MDSVMPRKVLHFNITPDPVIFIYSTYHNYLSCASVQDIEYEYRCEYVVNTTECQDKGNFFNYIEILYCSLAPTSDNELYAHLILFIFLCFLMFFILGTTAARFFGPSLEMLAKVMGLSEHLAGVTLLAFGNGSPDLFTTLASVDTPSSTMYTNLFGAAIFVTAFVGGFICVLRPFALSGNNFLRDTFFFILSTMWIDHILESDAHVTLIEASSVMLIYVVYLVVIVMDQFLLKRQVNNMERLMQKGRMSLRDYKSYNLLRQEAVINIVGASGSSVNINANRSSFFGYDISTNENLYKQALASLNPIDMDEWHSSSWFQKAIMGIKAPMYFLLLLFIPVVSYEEERHGWSKLLNCIQIVMLPVSTTFLMFSFNSVYGMPIFIYALILCIPLAIAAFVNSRTDAAPSFHVAIACLTAFGAMFVIYTCASETVEILYVLGLVMNCSNSFLGTTLLAWGNGVGDLISNAALAIHGHEKMAFAACIGGPFFNTVFSFGAALMILTLKSEDGTVKIPSGPLGDNCFIFMMIVLLCTIMWSATTDFHVRRSVGIFNIIIYLLFVLYIILGELEIIQTYAYLSEYGTTSY